MKSRSRKDRVGLLRTHMHRIHAEYEAASKDGESPEMIILQGKKGKLAFTTRKDGIRWFKKYFGGKPQFSLLLREAKKDECQVFVNWGGMYVEPYANLAMQVEIEKMSAMATLVIDLS